MINLNSSVQKVVIKPDQVVTVYSGATTNLINVGTGEEIYAGLQGTASKIRTIQGSTGIHVHLSGDTIYVESTGGAGSGDVVGATISEDNNIVLYQGLTGKVIKDSGKKLSDFSLTGHTHTEYALESSLTGHTSDLSIHYPMSGITITESQVSGLTQSLSGKQDTINFVVESEGKFLRDDETFQYIEPPVGGYANNLYFSDLASDIPTYNSLSYTPDVSGSTHTHTVNASEGDKLLHAYIYPSGVAVNNFPSGLWSFDFYGKVSNDQGVTQIGVTYFKRSTGNTETDLFTAWSDDINNTLIDGWIRFNITNPNYVLDPSDRMGARVFARTTRVSDVTVSYQIGDGYGAFLNNPNKIRHSQLRDLNGDTNYLHVTSTEKSTWNAKQDAGNYALESDLTGHTSNQNIHFVMSGITITESQVTGLVGDLNNRSLTGHTHSESEVINLVKDLNERSLTGHTHSQYVPYTTVQDAKDYTGWVDGDNIDVSYNRTNRTITLTGDLTYQWRGIRSTLTSPFTSIAHAATTGTWYLSSSDGINFTWSQTSWGFADIMVAYVYYSTVSPDLTFAIKETHGLMDYKSHEEFHTQIGTYRISGGQPTAGTYIENTPTDAANAMGFDAAVLKDEDVLTTVPALPEGNYLRMYVSGNTSVFAVDFPLPFQATVNTYIQVNNPLTGTMTAGVNSRWYNVYQILMPCASDSGSQKYRMIMLQPQQTFTSLALAQAENVSSLALGSLQNLSPEFFTYTRITYVTSNLDNNNGKCRIATNGISYVVGNKVSQVNVIGGGTSDHTALSNLAFIDSAHTGAADTLAAFNASGLAETLPKATYSLSGHTHSQYALNDTLTGHTSDLSIHYAMSGITISESQVTGLVADLNSKSSTGHTHTEFQTLNNSLTGHTSNNDIHYVMSGITITESQVTGLVGDLNNRSLTGHTHAYATTGGTETFTNKRITKRVQYSGDTATLAINTDNYDMAIITGLTQSLAFTITGTPTFGQTLWIAITGTAARAITWGTSFEASTIALPTTTVSTNRLDCGFVWNATTSKWRIVATA